MRLMWKSRCLTLFVLGVCFTLQGQTTRIMETNRDIEGVFSLIWDSVVGSWILRSRKGNLRVIGFYKLGSIALVLSRWRVSKVTPSLRKIRSGQIASISGHE